jgi:hypothetical protein
MIKPLVISKDFCDSENPAGMVDRDFWDNLPKDSYSPIIFCSDWHAKINNNSNVIRVKEILGARIVKGLLNRCPIPDFRYLPDYNYITWAWLAEIRIANCLKKNRFDYIDSLGMPHASHLLALKLKRQTGLPWIARFYDPWIDNQFMRYKFDYFRKMNERMERFVAENADVIIHNNEHIADLWRNRYGSKIADKIIVIPMIFNWKKMPPPSSRCHEDGKLIISHIGNLFGVRTAHFLIMGINELVSKHPELRHHIIVNLVGMVPKVDKEEIKQLKLDEIFNTPGILPENECHKYFVESDLFISIDGRGESDLNYPSKLLKYFYYGKPILGLTLENSVAAEELDDSGNYHVLYSDVKSISGFLERAFFNYNSLNGFNREYYLKFSKERVLDLYDSIVRNLLNHK